MSDGIVGDVMVEQGSFALIERVKGFEDGNECFIVSTDSQRDQSSPSMLAR